MLTQHLLIEALFAAADAGEDETFAELLADLVRYEREHHPPPARHPARYVGRHCELLLVMMEPCRERL